jgi:transcriptional regulator with XRE-family HTH domain
MIEYQNQVRQCLKAIKSQIKSRNITYQYMADRLGVSLVTVKRQLNANDLSLSKLLALCEAAGLDFLEAWQSIAEQKPLHTFITAEQDKAFFNNPHLMRFFFKLYIGKQSPEQIQKQCKLTSSSLHLYLRKLESLELISSFTSQKVTLAVAAPLGFGAGSLVLRQGLSAALKDCITAINQEHKTDQFLLLKPMRLSDELRSKMREEIEDVISQFAELSERYFSNSDHKLYNLVAFEYRESGLNEAVSIKNVRGFK